MDDEKSRFNVEKCKFSMDEEKSRFIVEKCEMVMESVIGDREILQKKANALLGIIGGAASLALGIWLTHPLVEVLQRALGIQILFLLAMGIVLIFKCLMPSDYAPPGGDTRRLLQPDFVNQEIQWLRIGYSLLVQKGINLNLKRNSYIAYWIKLVAISAFVSPVASYFVSWITLLLGSSPQSG